MQSPEHLSNPTSFDARICAFLKTIRQFESGDDYGRLYGGAKFSDYAKHPNVRVPINLPGYEGKFSTAAGAYQINYPTYCDFAGQLSIHDFAPDSQDMLAVAILKSTGAITALALGDVERAFTLASKRWASLPGSVAGQHPQAMKVALSAYDKHLELTGVV